MKNIKICTFMMNVLLKICPWSLLSPFYNDFLISRSNFCVIDACHTSQKKKGTRSGTLWWNPIKSPIYILVTCHISCTFMMLVYYHLVYLCYTILDKLSKAIFVRLTLISVQCMSNAVQDYLSCHLYFLVSNGCHLLHIFVAEITRNKLDYFECL